MAKQFTLEQLLPVATTLTAFDAAGNVVPDVVTPSLTWTSSNPEVATVGVREDGTVFVTSIAPGTATITASGTLPNGVVISGSNDVEVLAPVVVETPAPVVVEETPAAPVVVEEPAAPVVVEEPAAPVVVEETPVVVEEPAAPVVVEEPAAPVVVEEPAAPVVVEEPAAPVVVEEPAAPVVVEEPAAPAAPEVASASLAVDFGEPVAKP
jgi:outer membrane biosynthesis protein TonB